MFHAIQRLPEVLKRTGLSRSTVYSLIQQGKFPKQIKLSQRAVGWPDSVITEWIERRINESNSESEVAS